MDENMLYSSSAGLESRPTRIHRTWHYEEQVDKKVVYHTISVNGKRFTHISETEETGKKTKKRSDINLNDVRYVTARYATTRNIIATVIFAILAALFFIASLVFFFGDMDELGIVAGIFMIIIGISMALTARKIYIKSYACSFVLEMEMYVKARTFINEKISYGINNADFGQSKDRRPSLVGIAFLIIVWPIGILYLLKRLRSRGGRVRQSTYKLIMDSAVGNDIVITLGNVVGK